MGLLNRIKMLWRAAVGSSYSWPAMDIVLPGERYLHLVGSIHMGTRDMSPPPARLLKKAERLGLELFEQEGLAPYLPLWEKLDTFIHRPVKLIIGDKEIYGISRGIDAQGALLLEQYGVIKAWVGGEISLRSAE